MLINRDPFARQELHRSREYVTSQACSECGGIRKTKSGRYFLYCYGTERDGVSASYTARQNHKGLFCCKSCHDSYHS